jgi:RNA polymerase sigma factor (sigma-70 family)
MGDTTPALRPYTGDHDDAVIAAIQDYAQRAFGTELNFERFLKSTAIKRECAVVDKDDLIQESLFTVLNAAGHYDEQRGGNPENYVVRALANNALNLNVRERRHWSKRHQGEPDREDGQEDLILTIPDTETADPEQTMIGAEAIQQIRAMLTILPASLKSLFKLLYDEDLNQRAAAARMGISQPRVAQLHRELIARGQAHFGLTETKAAA